MKFEAKRLIYFTSDMKGVTAFYKNVLRLKPKIDPAISADEWIEFDAGGIKIALHRAGNAKGKAGTLTRAKLVFFARDVKKVRQYLIKKKVKMGPLHNWGKLVLCDGQDPDGNKFQISNRR
jgi:hypothetical protein